MTSHAFSDAQDESGDNLGFLETATPEPSFLEMGPPSVETPIYDTVDPKFVRAPRKPSGAPAYEKKIRGLLKGAFDFTVGSSATVTDAAAIYQYQDNIAVKGALLAAENASFAKGIDFLTEGTDNATLAFVLACFPLAVQIIRNHEPVLEPVTRGIKIPFTKKTFKPPIKLGIRLGRIRAYSHDPRHLYTVVLDNDSVKAELKKQGVNVASLPSVFHPER